ncbi:MAG TPA: serine/threonine-protein kinase, partial [Candidatus Cybelea sp.]|nr:serine/threonine-protein kinase [Candidatus Cybelea sp.]
MGVVYRAEDQSTRRTIALKQLQSDEVGAQRRMIEALFEREYHTLARLEHPSIIEVYDYGIERTGPYYTMELLSGSDLRDLAPLPYIDVCKHLCDVASALALLHAHRLVHRDLSPRNVRLADDGRVKLLDFGALTSFGRPESVVGTPQFVAPEMMYRMPVDQRADLFALGALAYWALTGTNAFPAKRLTDLGALWTKTPPRPSTLRDE